MTLGLFASRTMFKLSVNKNHAFGMFSYVTEGRSCTCLHTWVHAGSSVCFPQK